MKEAVYAFIEFVLLVTLPAGAVYGGRSELDELREMIYDKDSWKEAASHTQKVFEYANEDMALEILVKLYFKEGLVNFLAARRGEFILLDSIRIHKDSPLSQRLAAEYVSHHYKENQGRPDYIYGFKVMIQASQSLLPEAPFLQALKSMYVEQTLDSDRNSQKVVFEVVTTLVRTCTKDSLKMLVELDAHLRFVGSTVRLFGQCQDDQAMEILLFFLKNSEDVFCHKHDGPEKGASCRWFRVGVLGALAGNLSRDWLSHFIHWPPPAESLGIDGWSKNALLRARTELEHMRLELVEAGVEEDLDKTMSAINSAVVKRLAEED